MEKEELYKLAQSKIHCLTATLTSLNDFSFTKTLSDVHKDIENHFEMLFKTMQQRKEDLISTVDKLAQELHKQIEAEKEKIIQNIEDINKMIENGVSSFDSHCDIALERWQKIRKIVHNENIENKRVQVEFFTSLVEAITSHGTVFIESVSLEPKAVRTLAGSTDGNVDGQGMNAKFSNPYGITFNTLDDCLYVCDYGNNMIRKVTRSGNVSKFVDCCAPVDIEFYQKGQCYYVSEWESHSIKSISLKGEVNVYAGIGVSGYEDGERKNAKFKFPWGIAVNQETGDVYVSDSYNYVIRKITPQGQVSTIAGTPSKSGYSEDIKSTLFRGPYGLCFHPQRKALVVCDYYNNRLRKILLDGTVTTVCKISRPQCASVTSDGSILVSSLETNQIFKVHFNDNKIELKVVAGSGKKGNRNGSSHESEFNGPYGIAIDHKTNHWFIADNVNRRIRIII